MGKRLERKNNQGSLWNLSIFAPRYQGTIKILVYTLETRNKHLIDIETCVKKGLCWIQGNIFWFNVPKGHIEKLFPKCIEGIQNKEK